VAETRKLAAILVSDVVGYSRLAGADEDRILARLRTLRSDLIDPTIAIHHGRIVKRTGDGAIIEFRSVVDAVRCAIEVQNGMRERNTGVPDDQKIQFRVGIHLGDVVEESDGDLMGDGVNIAARLEGLAKPGAICLSEDAYRQVKQRLDIRVTDLGPTSLKNIADPIHAYSLEVGQPATAKSAAAPAPEKPAPPRLSLVVLPFANLSGDTEQEYFVDGVTESLTTDLSRVRGSFVIARNTAFTYKGKPFDVRQISRELNVRYVLEGSVQRGGNRMRVNVQLIEAETGNHLWADRFDKPVADLFEMQDEIVARLANQLGAQLMAAEARRAERAPNPDSVDLYFQGTAWYNKGGHPEHLARAESLLERAVELDPGNVDALATKAVVTAVAAANYTPLEKAERFAAAEAAATRALSLAPDHPWAHACMGHVLTLTNRAERGIEELERALALDQNLASAHGLIGMAKLLLGRGEEVEAHVLDALRVSPRDIRAYLWLSIAGIANLSLNRNKEAAASLRRSIEANRNYPVPHWSLAAALARSNQVDEARSAAKVALSLDPTFSIARFRAAAMSDNPTYLARRELVIDALRIAGIPEQ
jgi:TolB-like protein/class 3 adenylate cyclase/Flp pilus assembly protein TadD